MGTKVAGTIAQPTNASRDQAPLSPLGFPPSSSLSLEGPSLGRSSSCTDAEAVRGPVGTTKDTTRRHWATSSPPPSTARQRTSGGRWKRWVTPSSPQRRSLPPSWTRIWRRPQRLSPTGGAEGPESVPALPPSPVRPHGSSTESTRIPDRRRLPSLFGKHVAAEGGLP